MKRQVKKLILQAATKLRQVANLVSGFTFLFSKPEILFQAFKTAYFLYKTCIYTGFNEVYMHKYTSSLLFTVFSAKRS